MRKWNKMGVHVMSAQVENNKEIDTTYLPPPYQHYNTNDKFSNTKHYGHPHIKIYTHIMYIGVWVGGGA